MATSQPKATLTEIEEAVETELAQLRKQLVEEMVQANAAESLEEPDFPQCGRLLVFPINGEIPGGKTNIKTRLPTCVRS